MTNKLSSININKLTNNVIENFKAIIRDVDSENDREDSIKLSRSKMSAPPIIHGLIEQEYLERISRKKNRLPDCLTNIDDLDELIKQFKRLYYELNKLCIIPPSRTSFCIFSRISTNDYFQAMEGIDVSEEITHQFRMLEDYIIEVLNSMALIGDISNSMAKNLLNTFGAYGHNQTTIKNIGDFTDCSSKENKLSEQIMKELQSFSIE